MAAETTPNLKKNKQHTYWTAYYVGLAIKKLMLLLELGDIDERFGKTIYIFQLLAESFFKCNKIKREVSLIKMRRVNGDCRLKRTTNHKRVDSCLGKFGQVHGMANG